MNVVPIPAGDVGGTGDRDLAFRENPESRSYSDSAISRAGVRALSHHYPAL